MKLSKCSLSFLRPLSFEIVLRGNIAYVENRWFIPFPMPS